MNTLVLGKRKRYPNQVVFKAQQTLAAFEAGEVRPRLMEYSRAVRVLNVGLFYRLVSCASSRGKWQLLSHEDYNKRVF